MGKRIKTKSQQQRLLLAMEAARVIVESGQDDFQQAKRKAALRLGVPETRNLPSNLEIHTALEEYHRLFRVDKQPAHLKRLRDAALKAMQLFAVFQPRLTGSVLSGTATDHAMVELHLFADPAEAVVIFLLDHLIPYQEGQRKIRFSAELVQQLPTYRFVADDITVELVVFPSTGIRQAPRSPVDGKPMRRATATEVRALTETNEYAGIY